MLQQRIQLKRNLLKLYPGKSSGSQVWELRLYVREEKKSSSRLKGWQIPPSARGSAAVAWTVSEKFDIQAAGERKFYQRRRLGVGKDADDVWGHRRSERRLERGHPGVGDKVRRRRRALALTPVTARACFVYTPGVLGAVRQVWLRLDLSRDWSHAVQVEFTGGLRYHWQNEWQTQNRVMEYYQEAICNPGRAWISKGCCLSEMKSSITSTSYLIRSWVAFKEKERLSVLCTRGLS